MAAGICLSVLGCSAPAPQVSSSALAELGRFDEAVGFQRNLVAHAQAAGASAAVRARLAANLGRYERGEAVRIRR